MKNRVDTVQMELTEPGYITNFIFRNTSRKYLYFKFLIFKNTLRCLQNTVPKCVCTTRSKNLRRGILSSRLYMFSFHDIYW